MSEANEGVNKLTHRPAAGTHTAENHSKCKYIASFPGLSPQLLSLAIRKLGRTIFRTASDKSWISLA